VYDFILNKLHIGFCHYIVINSLLYGLEACPLVKSELASLLDFVVNRFFLWRSLGLAIWMLWDSVNRALVSACRVCCGLIVQKSLTLNTPPAGAPL